MENVEQILQYAKLLYPPGTVFKSAASGFTYTVPANPEFEVEISGLPGIRVTVEGNSHPFVYFEGLKNDKDDPRKHKWGEIFDGHGNSAEPIIGNCEFYTVFN